MEQQEGRTYRKVMEPAECAFCLVFWNLGRMILNPHPDALTLRDADTAAVFPALHIANFIGVKE